MKNNIGNKGSGKYCLINNCAGEESDQEFNTLALKQRNDDDGHDEG